MFALLLPLLFSFSLASAQPITVECSDGQIQIELADLRASKCLRITQDESISYNFLSKCSLPDIDSRSLKLFLKLSKLGDDKIFAFIDSLTPEEFRLIDYNAKYLRYYHEIDALFKYKFLKEYSLAGSRLEMIEFVDRKFFQFTFMRDIQRDICKWQRTNLFEKYCPGFRLSENEFCHDYRAFFVLIDFYQQVMKKPLVLTTQHLKNIFYNFDSVLQNELLKKQLVIVR
jgi:hypothetical protein